jgi:hypothetical protein
MLTLLRKPKSTQQKEKNMTAEIRTAFKPGEAAYILRQHLGNDREWLNFLSDVRQGKITAKVPLLKPAGYVRDGLHRQPVYDAADIVQFVREWRAHSPKSGPNKKPERTYYFDDPSERPHWRTRILTEMV